MCCVCKWHIVALVFFLHLFIFFRSIFFFWFGVKIFRFASHWISLSCCVTVNCVYVMCYCYCLYFQFSLSEVYFVVCFIYSFRKLSDSRLDPIGCIHKDRLFRSYIHSGIVFNISTSLFSSYASYVFFFIYFKKCLCLFLKTTFFFYIFWFWYSGSFFFPSKYLSCMFYLNRIHTNIEINMRSKLSYIAKMLEATNDQKGTNSYVFL